jgi:hypothetical protein
MTNMKKKMMLYTMHLKMLKIMELYLHWWE